MPQVTPITKANLGYLFDLPTREVGEKEYLDDVVVWVHRADRHEVAIKGVQQPTKVWWEGMTLKAHIRVAYPNGDHIEFRYNNAPVWIVAARIGNRRQFTFSQDFSVGRVKIGPLLGV